MRNVEIIEGQILVYDKRKSTTNYYVTANLSETPDEFLGVLVQYNGRLRAWSEYINLRTN